jgi:cytochrome c556
MLKLKTALAAAVVMGTATFAVAYAQNPDVQKRQETMGIIGSNMKKLTQMSRGQISFDAGEAQAAFAKISEKAGEVPVVFEAEADDPESDAAPEIWFMWDEFTAKAEALKAAADAGAGVDSPDALNAALGNLGGACKSCHSQFKL